MSTDLLSSILAEFGQKQPRAPKAKPAKKADPYADLPQHKAFALRKTGYAAWTPTHREVHIREYTCTCCGASHRAVEDEFFTLHNKASRTVWSRHEGYGIPENAQDLPVRVVVLPDTRPVSACPACMGEPGIDALIARAVSCQMAFDF